MVRSAFIDSGVLIAAFLARDTHHDEAMAIVLAADEGKIPPLILTDYILAETLNFINRKGTHETAVEALRRIDASRGLIVERISEGIYATTTDDVFPSTSMLSFVDASTVAFMLHHKIRVLYSFDAGFDQIPSVTRLDRIAE